MNQSELDDIARAWSAHFHQMLFEVLAPRGFKTINDREHTREVADIDFLTRERIKRAAVMVMDCFRNEKQSLLESLSAFKAVQQKTIETNQDNFLKELKRFWPRTRRCLLYKNNSKTAQQICNVLTDIENMIKLSKPDEVSIF